MMTYEEAKHFIAEEVVGNNVIVKTLSKRKKPVCGIDAITMCVEALEKRIPKKPNIIGDGYADGEMVYDEWECPSCGSVYEIYSHEYEHCPKCGQAIDWSDDDDNE